MRAVSAVPSSRVAPASWEQVPVKGARTSPTPEYASTAVPVAGPAGSRVSACASAAPAGVGGAAGAMLVAGTVAADGGAPASAPPPDPVQPAAPSSTAG